MVTLIAYPWDLSYSIAISNVHIRYFIVFTLLARRTLYNLSFFKNSILDETTMAYIKKYKLRC
jgi:hypothetical protein